MSWRTFDFAENGAMGKMPNQRLETATPMSPTTIARDGFFRSTEEESLLIGQVLVGRGEVFMDLLQPHLGSLARLVRFQMRNDVETEDVLQQTILHAFARLNQFRFEARFKTWLVRIATNEVLQWRRRRVTSKLDLFDHDGLTRLQLADDTPSPLRECERVEALGLFRGALAKLPMKYRDMIRCRDLEGLSISQTAQVLHVSANTVKTRHRRARLKMLHLLTPTPGCRLNSPAASPAHHGCQLSNS